MVMGYGISVGIWDICGIHSIFILFCRIKHWWMAELTESITAVFISYFSPFPVNFSLEVSPVDFSSVERNLQQVCI
jgi:hypothetical protein